MRAPAWRGFSRNTAGATALEFAMVAPVFVAMLLGIFYLGYAMYCGSAVRSAIQRSSRALIAAPSTSAATLQTNAQALLVDVPVEDLAITITTETVSSTEQIKRISWTYDYMLKMPLLSDVPLAMGSSIVVPMAPQN